MAPSRVAIERESVHGPVNDFTDNLNTASAGVPARAAARGAAPLHLDHSECEDAPLLSCLCVHQVHHLPAPFHRTQQVDHRLQNLQQCKTTMAVWRLGRLDRDSSDNVPTDTVMPSL